MTAENLKTRMRNPRFGLVYRNFQLSWAKVRNKEITKPLWQPKELGKANFTAPKKTEHTILYMKLQTFHLTTFQIFVWFSDLTIDDRYDLIRAFHSKIFRLYRYIYIQLSLEQHTASKTPWCLQKQLQGDAYQVVFKLHQQIYLKEKSGLVLLGLVRDLLRNDTLIAACSTKGEELHILASCFKF